MTTSFRLAADVGGTFTDLVLSSSTGQYATKKVLSTPGEYWRGVVDGSVAILKEAGVRPDQVVEICHATTVATNAVLERSGPRTGLITTRGFRDVLELRRMRFPDTYNLFWDKPEPLIDRYLRLEVDERIDARGSVIRPLNEEQALDVIRRLVEVEQVEALAVALISAPVNARHEHVLQRLVHDHFPNVFLSLSSEVLTELREYERTSTTVLNAYLQPLLSRYLQRMATEFRAHGLTAPVYIMQSAGGIMSMEAACRFPVHVLESGPAAGIMGAAHFLSEIEDTAAVTFDMGGTTAKAAMIEGRQPVKGSEFEIGAPISVASRVLKGGGYLVRVPAIDVAEVGAGGGSIAFIDSGGALAVGPKSAGSAPGPACYGQGGEAPTVTDANLLLGFLSAEGLLAGGMPLDCARAERAIGSMTADLRVVELAHGIRTVAVHTMARAVRAVSTERGRDVRKAVLVAFGGNGPVHATALAESLGMQRVLIPRSAGVFSALGLLFSDHERTLVRPFQGDLMTTAVAVLTDAFQELESKARSEFASAADAHIAVSGFVDLRYRGQASELRIAVPQIAEIGQKQLRTAFEEEYRRTFGHDQAGASVRLVNIGCIVRTAAPRGAVVEAGKAVSRAQRVREVYFSAQSGFVSTPVLHDRAALDRRSVAGPLLLEEYDSTTVVPPGWSASLTRAGSILLQRSEAA